MHRSDGAARDRLDDEALAHTGLGARSCIIACAQLQLLGDTIGKLPPVLPHHLCGFWGALQLAAGWHTLLATQSAGVPGGQSCPPNRKLHRHPSLPPPHTHEHLYTRACAHTCWAGRPSRVPHPHTLRSCTPVLQYNSSHLHPAKTPTHHLKCIPVWSTSPAYAHVVPSAPGPATPELIKSCGMHRTSLFTPISKNMSQLARSPKLQPIQHYGFTTSHQNVNEWRRSRSMYHTHRTLSSSILSLSTLRSLALTARPLTSSNVPCTACAARKAAADPPS